MSTLRLSTQLQQKMILTPQLRQRIEMLQMTSLELNDLVQEELLSNPILEEVQPNEEVAEISTEILDQNADSASYELVSANAPEITFDSENETRGDSEKTAEEFQSGETSEESFSDESRDAFDEIDYGREFQDYLDPGYKTQEIEYKDDAPSFEQFLSHSPTLSEHLEWQLNLLEISEEIEEIAAFIVGNLDSDGRLSMSSDEISAQLKKSPELVESARKTVMALDPVGCGAHTVGECLFAQLEAIGEADSLAAQVVLGNLENLQPHRLQHLAKETGRTLEELNDVLKRIRMLDPYPGRRYSSEEPIYVSPEVYVEKVDDDYVIYFTDDGSPRLRISQTYQQLLNQGDTTKETKDFIKDNVRSAVDLLRNIEHRRQTIYRVVDCIVRRQLEFLNHGLSHLKPMMLKDVAEDIGMHLSTISRVVNRKYAHTPQGVIELRKFFSEGMLNEDGEEVSTRILKQKIKKMIEDENSRKPLTDDDIAKILSKEGVKLSRRTVAKYRDQMQIPGSRERKTVV